jgi:hypothetical protein
MRQAKKNNTEILDYREKVDLETVAIEEKRL